MTTIFLYPRKIIGGRPMACPLSHNSPIQNRKLHSMCSWYLLQSKLRNLKWPHSNCLSRLDVERRDTWQKEQQGNMKKRYCHPRSRTSELYRQNCCDCPVSRVGLWPVPEDSHGTGSTILGKLIWSSFATLSRGLSFLIWQEENLDVGRWASSPARHSPPKFSQLR